MGEGCQVGWGCALWRHQWQDPCPAHPSPSPRLEYEARNQKKEAKELAFLEARRQQEAQPPGERD